MSAWVCILLALCSAAPAASCDVFDGADELQHYRFVHSTGSNSDLLHPYVGQEASTFLGTAAHRVNLSPMGGLELYGRRYHDLFTSKNGFLAELHRDASYEEGLLVTRCPPSSVSGRGVSVYGALGELSVEGLYSEHFPSCTRPPLHGPTQPCVVVEWRNATRSDEPDDSFNLYMYLYQGGEIAIEISSARVGKRNGTLTGLHNKGVSNGHVDGVFAPCETADADTYVAVFFTSSSCAFRLADAVAAPSGPCTVYDERDVRNTHMMLYTGHENGAMSLGGIVAQQATNVLGYPGEWEGGSFAEFVVDVSEMGGFPFYGGHYYKLYASANGMISYSPGMGGDYVNRCPLPWPTFNGPVIRYTSVAPRIYVSHSISFDPLGGMFEEFFDSCPRPVQHGIEQPCVVVEWRNHTNFATGAAMNMFAYLYPSGEIAVELESSEEVTSFDGFTQGVQNGDADLGVSVCIDDEGPVATNEAIVMFPFEACDFTGVSIEELTGPCNVFDGIDFGRQYRFIHSTGANAPDIGALVGQQLSTQFSTGDSYVREWALNLTSIGGFPFFGEHYDELYVNTAGGIGTADGLQSDFFSYCPLPQETFRGTGGRIYAFHALEVSDGVFTEEFELCPRPALHIDTQPCVVVEWRGCEYAGGGPEHPRWDSFVYLYPNGEVAIEVRTVRGEITDTAGVVGVMSADRRYGVSSRCRESLPAEYVAVFFPEDACPKAEPTPTPTPLPAPLSITPFDVHHLIDGVGASFRRTIKFLVLFPVPASVERDHFDITNCSWVELRPKSVVAKRDAVAVERATMVATEWVVTVEASCAGLVEVALFGVSGVVQYLPPCFLDAIS